ncbi:MAG: 5'-3' exonuclease H3TH domain-containing protein, partial [Bacillota bacterium]|nr:5'-3' exonuclease H3TH domain-containing protein [Bacillota bacterium]
MSDKKRFFIIDGNSLIHRAFHALPLLATAKGEFTNGVFGFTKMLLKIIKEEQPDYLAVAFDIGKVTFRHQQFAQYKGTRKATPDELRPQFQLVKELLAAMKIPIFELEGYEADDLIGTLVRQGEQQGYYNFIVTGDRDSLQLVSPATRVKLSRKGISEIEEYSPETLAEKYGLTADQFIDLKGLMGDSSDNIPGVPGIGEKTGLKLLHEYGTLESILAATGQIKGAKLQEKLREYKDQALLSKELATIACDAPIKITDVTSLDNSQWDHQRIIDIFSRLEFKSLINDLPKEIEQAQGTSLSLVVDTLMVDEPNAAKALEELLAKESKIFLALSWDSAGKNNYLKGELKQIAILVINKVFIWQVEQ